MLFDESGDPGEPVLGPDVAACETEHAAPRRHRRHRHRGGARLGHDGCGKTGTTDNRADAWFLGATAQLATAVWFGNRIGDVPGAGFGGDSAAPIFKAFMEPGARRASPTSACPTAGPVCARPGTSVNEDGGRDRGRADGDSSPSPR